MKLKTTVTAAVLLQALSANAFADGAPLMVNPSTNSKSGAPATSMVTRDGTGNFTIRIINSCFATNLRAVTNPLAPTSIVTANLQINVQDGKSAPTEKFNLWVKYPAALVTQEGINRDAEKPMEGKLFGGLDGMSAGLYGNTVEVRAPLAKAHITMLENGDKISKLAASSEQPSVTIGERSFVQEVTECGGPAVYGSWGWSTFTPTYNCGSYMGKNGPLSVMVNSINVASDNTSLELNVAFPGQTGFCGGYFSPLMLFFDEARPKFSGTSPFKLSAAGETWWVEANAPGYLLAMDRNHNGKIDGKEELFGDQDSDKNGFDSLKDLDSNHDGVIDAKDAKFKQLLLWNDKNGDGISQPAELEPLYKRVTKISLKYTANIHGYGDAAQGRQASEFWFKDKGKSRKGVVEDIWFAPINSK